MKYPLLFFLLSALSYAQVANPSGGGQINNPTASGVSSVTAGTGLSGGGAGTPTLNVINPLPAGVAAGSACVSNGIGQPCAYQAKPVLDVRDFGTPTGTNGGTLIQAAHDSGNCTNGCIIDARGLGQT